LLQHVRDGRSFSFSPLLLPPSLSLSLCLSLSLSLSLSPRKRGKRGVTRAMVTRRLDGMGWD
jgi:hypothetical protein